MMKLTSRKYEEVSPQDLQNHFTYDSLTGKLLWKQPTARRVKVGDQAGCLSGAGYLTVDFKCHKFLVHQIIWAIHHNEWPADHIDHINRVQTDNRIENLRVAGRYVNMHNMSSHKDGSSPYKGVSWHKKAKKWQVRVMRYGVNTYLGLFDNEKDANNAYVNYEENLNAN